MSGIMSRAISAGKREYLDGNSERMMFEIQEVSKLIRAAYMVRSQTPIVRRCRIVFHSTIQAIEEAGLKAEFICREYPEECGFFDIYCQVLSLQELEDFTSKQVGKK